MFIMRSLLASHYLRSDLGALLDTSRGMTSDRDISKSRCNKANSDNNFYSPADPMNVSSRARSFT